MKLTSETIKGLDDIALSAWATATVSALRSRALLNRGYAAVALNLVRNGERNAALKAAGLPHEGFAPEVSQ